MKSAAKILLLLFVVMFVGCSGNDDEAESVADRLIGYWAITRIEAVEHIGGVHSAASRDVPPHGLDSYAGEINYRYDVLIFDGELVTVRGDMPSCPKGLD